jgi:methyl-accepting chemotaxis protein
MARLYEDITTITTHRLPAVVAIERMQQDFLTTRLETANLGYAQSPDEQKRILKRINSAKSGFQTSKKTMYALANADEAKALLKQLDNSVKQYDVLQQNLLNMYQNGEVEEANAYRKQGFLALSSDITQVLQSLAAFQSQRANTASADAKETYVSNRNLMIFVIFVTLVLTAAMAVTYSRSLIIPLREAVKIAQTIAKGDLSQTFSDDHKDEAGLMITELASMQVNLRNTIQEIADSSNQLAATSEELSVVTMQSTNNITRQGSELEHAVTAVNEMTVAIEEVARSSAYTYEESLSANTIATTGSEKVRQTIATVQALVNELSITKSGVDNLAQRVHGIGKVLDVIREIADQTNLLALNAAIEAARAGESGRGFAVVADEVRALAHRTQESTKEIENMIQLTHGDTEKAVSSTATSSESANRTLVAANESGASLQQISDIIGQINEQNMAIASAVEQQATVIKEVDKNLVNIRDLAEQTAVGAGQSNTSTGELASLADNLNNLVLKFKLH